MTYENNDKIPWELLREASQVNLTEFGLLVKTLRNNSVDEYGNRWTRESLSEAIHLTPNQLGRLERGDRKYLDTQTLQLLAKCLNLTNHEQKEFLFASVGLTDKELFNQEEPQVQLNNLVTLMGNIQIPAFVIDAYGDIVAVNSPILNLFLITPDLIDYAKSIPAGLNHMNFVYSSDLGFKHIIGPRWRQIARTQILLFRRSSLRYRHTDYFNYIFKILQREKQFDIDWYSSHRDPEQFDAAYQRFEYDHPRYGPLCYVATETIINTKKGDLSLILYNPADAATNSVFDKLKGTNNNVRRLASWPEKKMV